MLSRARFFLCCVIAGMIGIIPAAGQETSVPSVREKFAGAWRLVSIETVRPNGEVIYPFYGKHPEGLIVYDRSGWMSVQIVSDPPPTVPTSRSREETIAASRPKKPRHSTDITRTAERGPSTLQMEPLLTTFGSPCIRVNVARMLFDILFLMGTASY